jgi:hypothetical protein
MGPENEADGRSDQPAAQQNMFEGETGSNPEQPNKRKRSAQKDLTPPPSLQRLRDRVELAARELARLRQENAQLQKQLQEAQASEFDELSGTPVIFTDSPDALRSRVESFIQTLDRYIERSEDRSEVTTPNTESGQ